MNRDLWLGVELRHFAALEAIADEGSFRGAADQLGYVQSAVSHQIATLEQLVGERLVERSRGHAPVRLTPAGELLRHHANGILARMKAARADLGSLGEGQGGSVRVGTFESAATRLLPGVLTSHARQRPDVRVVPVECATDAEVFELVAQGELDLGVTYLPLESGPFASCGLFRSPIVLVVAADSPLARAKRAPTLDEIARLPLIGHRRCRRLARVEDLMRPLRGSLNVVYRSDLSQTTQGLVAAGIGVALLPRFAVDARDERTAIVELDDRLPAAEVSMIWHRDRLLTPAAESFGELLRAACLEARDEADARAC
jgi:molybdate transport repressor ModE-like protein